MVYNMKMGPHFEKLSEKTWPALFCRDDKAKVTTCGYMMAIKTEMIPKHKLIPLYVESISCFWKLNNLIQCVYWHLLLLWSVCFF